MNKKQADMVQAFLLNCDTLNTLSNSFNLPNLIIMALFMVDSNYAFVKIMVI